jgi:hypothetical protein
MPFVQNINAPLAPILVNAIFIISSLHPKLDFSQPYPTFSREQLEFVFSLLRSFTMIFVQLY